MPQETHVHLTQEMVRALAHPLRMRILGTLRVDGPSTSTALAERLETNTGATSYHLRQLADVGLVEEDDRDEGGRRRWWKASHESMSWRDTEHDDDPEARAAADWLIRSSHRNYGQWVDDWHHARTQWPVEWRDASDQSDFGIRVKPDRLAELNKRIGELINSYDDPDEGAEPVAIVYYSLPRAAIVR